MKFKDKPSGYVAVETPCGRVKGMRKDGVLIFKGIRYAAAGRFEEPALVTQWAGEYDATKNGPWCCQYNAFFEGFESPFSKFYYDQATEKPVIRYGEDCLNLNIWAPEGAENAPVAVFVHGGSFVSGGNSASYILGQEYCRRGIVLVSVNYRLNAFGSAYEPGYPANLMLRDQIAAFRWVRQNIAAFGGNPDCVTGIGESAGALSLQCFLYSPHAKGLMTGAVLMSGGGNLTQLGIPAWSGFSEATWALVKQKYGADTIGQLKEIPAQELYAAWGAAAAEDVSFLNNCAKPLVDGDVIPASVQKLLADGAINDVPCVIGLSSEDMWPFTLYTKAVEWALLQNAAGRSPVYGYYMDRQLPGDNAGAFHACDLWYAFGALDNCWRPFTKTDYRISENMLDYFAEFIRTGNPGTGGGKLAEWTSLTQESAQFLRFGDDEAAMIEPPADKLERAVQNSSRPFPVA
ncbi:MAG: carboxylesterase family protein [Oscillospiraceae bacterium]|jgi:para-nitrobenzyl esterase|nr:carboxylesterase family protein [Oscillospiraceae bacterium]